MLLQTTGSSWDLRMLIDVRTFWAILVGFLAVFIGLVFYLRRQERRRKLARQAKASH